jgi:hypothetical protein
MRFLNLAGVSLFLVHTGIYAQQITEVSQQVVGDKVIIKYNLLETRDDQAFDVALYISQDNFSKALRNVSGNGVGDDVLPGSDRTIIWNVLDDVKELVGDFNFEVRALVRPKTFSKDASASRTVVISNKDEAYPEISNTITNYINEAKDLKDAFQFSAAQALESRQALKSLSEAVDQYNLAYEKLNKERFTYEKYVDSYWKKDILTLEFKNLMDYAIGDLHTVNILTLSEKIRVMNDLYQGRIKGSRKISDTKKELTKDISEEVVKLDKRLQELERRANRVLYNLGQD